MERAVPLLRSRKLSRYKIDTAGRSLKSSVLSNFFSFMAPGTISTSLAEEEDAAGASFFSDAIVTFALVFTRRCRDVCYPSNEDAVQSSSYQPHHPRIPRSFE